jgi:glutaconyl-CoA/methylmalonyl-CoA decarboxylase subunit delta
MKMDWSNILNEGVILNSVVTIIAIAVLIFLYRLFAWIYTKIRPNITQRMKRKGRLFGKESDSHTIPADHSAAIALALYLNNELHDEESNVLTIERVSRIYSPWSSKYYNMRKPPR